MKFCHRSWFFGPKLSVNKRKFRCTISKERSSWSNKVCKLQTCSNSQFEIAKVLYDHLFISTSHSDKSNCLNTFTCFFFTDDKGKSLFSAFYFPRQHHSRYTIPHERYLSRRNVDSIINTASLRHTYHRCVHIVNSHSRSIFTQSLSQNDHFFRYPTG